MSMTQPDTIATISELLANIIDEDELKLAPSTTAEDVEDWDSLAHVNLILALESRFSIKFSTGEIGASENVGQLAELVMSKAA